MADGGEDLDEQKRAAAEAAVSEVKDGMLVGLGTGSTAAYAVAALGRRVADGLDISAVATSDRTAAAAEAAGIGLLDFSRIEALDICIDGVDEIDASLQAIKGRGRRDAPREDRRHRRDSHDRHRRQQQAGGADRPASGSG